MHANLSRITFDRANGFSGVVALQGSLVTDADLNEGEAIQVEALRTAIADLVGPHAGPAGATGFLVGPVTEGGRNVDVYLGPGRYYVDGIAVETGADDDGVLLDRTAYLEQPFRRLHPEDDALPDDQAFFVYVRVFERLVTPVQAPFIRDAALGPAGPETAERSQIVWQVLTAPVEGDPGDDRDAAIELWATEVAPGLEVADPGRLTADAAGPGDEDDLCALSPDARFQGTQNHLYRVEIHHPGTIAGSGGDPPTIKWSRDNGSETYAVEGLDQDQVVLASLGRDEELTLTIGDWVEVSDDLWAAEQRHGPLLQVVDVDPGERRVTLSGDVASDVGHDEALHPFLRRWHQQSTARAPLTDGAVPVTGGTWIPLEDGVQVKLGDGTFRTGDFWVIPARTDLGVVWPPGGHTREDRLPHGIRYHFAPLALVRSLATPSIVDLRCAFEPLPCVAPDQTADPWEHEAREVKRARRRRTGRPT